MRPSAPSLGLLLDVDGVIASLSSRRIVFPSITEDIVTLANAGIPIALNTGRSDIFVRDQVVKPVLAAGLLPDARFFCVCEMGAVWFGATLNNFDGVNVDEAVAVPAAIASGVRALVQDRYSETMYWDDKRAMVSVEQRTDVSTEDFYEAQPRFIDDSFDLIESHGVGVSFGDRRSGDNVTLRIDPTRISTDIESVRSGKDLGAARALRLIEASGAMPEAWRTVGDSRRDYAMADALHARGLDVTHVDVHPADGIPDKAYPVVTEGDLEDDAAGAALFRRWASTLGS